MAYVPKVIKKKIERLKNVTRVFDSREFFSISMTKQERIFKVNTCIRRFL